MYKTNVYAGTELYSYYLNWIPVEFNCILCLLKIFSLHHSLLLSKLNGCYFQFNPIHNRVCDAVEDIEDLVGGFIGATRRKKLSLLKWARLIYVE